MELTEITDQTHPILKPAGELDLFAAPDLRAAFQSHLDLQTPVLVLDLSEVEFMDSSALSELIAYRQSAANFGGVLRIAALGGDVRELFAIAGLSSFFCVFETAEDALVAAA